MSIRVVERAIITGDESGQVGVRRELFGTNVTVKWFCGDSRTFTPAEIKSIVRCLDVLGEYPDVWFAHTDSRGERFVARIHDGMLHASVLPEGDGAGIDWVEMKKALAKAVK